jgi:predicted RNase H-like nuclease (RuvC/YqgF family)
VRRDEMEKYKLRCTVDDRREKINNLEEELFEQRQSIMDLEEQVKNTGERYEEEIRGLREGYNNKINELNIAISCRNIDYEQLEASNKLKLEKYESEGAKYLVL